MTTGFSTGPVVLELGSPSICWGFSTFIPLYSGKNVRFFLKFIENFYSMILKIVTTTFSRFSSFLIVYTGFKKDPHFTTSLHPARRGGGDAG